MPLHTNPARSKPKPPQSLLSLKIENLMKLLQLSRMFRRASFGSCRTRDSPDIIEEAAVFVPQNQTHHFRVFEAPPPQPPSPKPRPFPSICKPQTGPRQKVSDRYYSPLGFADNCRSNGPPVSPISPFLYYKKERKNNNRNERSGSKHLSKEEKKKSRVKSMNREARLLRSSSSSLCNNSAYYYYSWSAGDDDDDDDDEENDRRTLFSSRSRCTLFSSRSTTLSSDSSGSLRLKRRSSRRRRSRERVGSRNNALLPLKEERRVEDSFAVVKKSSDPHNDFRTSMLEMIVEKQIFGAKDLEKLLQLLISLNSKRHHRIIVEVFTEILETLFCDWS